MLQVRSLGLDERFAWLNDEPDAVVEKGGRVAVGLLLLGGFAPHFSRYRATLPVAKPFYLIERWRA